MKTYALAIAVLLLTLAAHMVGINGFYWTIPAYDVFMHILGGIGIGLFLTAFMKSNFSSEESIFVKRRKVLVGVLLVGVVWELFEMYFNIAGAPLGTKAYFIDTGKDLLDDLIGGAVAVWICYRKIKD
jgi:hypothetical protein